MRLQYLLMRRRRRRRRREWKKIKSKNKRKDLLMTKGYFDDKSPWVAMIYILYYTVLVHEVETPYLVSRGLTTFPVREISHQTPRDLTSHAHYNDQHSRGFLRSILVSCLPPVLYPRLYRFCSSVWSKLEIAWVKMATCADYQVR